MIKIENIEVVGWEHMIRGMRNPKNSWEKSDSYSCSECYQAGLDELGAKCEGCNGDYLIGPNDHKLIMDLAKGGPVHAKYRRMIVAYMDITAPLYWWKEFDTYKVGTVANSCSTMHKIHAKEFELGDFSCEHLTTIFMDKLETVISGLNDARDIYVNWDGQDNAVKKYFGNDKKNAWWQMIQLLPTSYNQKRTVMLNYEVLTNIYHSRKNHKLDEWHVFCDEIEKLPYSEIIIGGKE